MTVAFKLSYIDVEDTNMKFWHITGPGKRMAKKSNGQFLWRMATWPFIITRIPFLANGHGHSLGIESESGEWPVTIKSEYSDTKKSRVKLGLG